MRHDSDAAKLAFSQLCLSIDSTYTKGLLTLLEAGDKHFLEHLKMPEVISYSSAVPFSLDYLAYTYLKKYTGFRCDVDKSAAAFSKWQSAEEQCQRTNTRLRSRIGFNPNVEARILQAQRKIAKVLGVFSFEKVLKDCEMGPGATFDLDRRSPPGFKRQLPLSVTPDALPYAKAWMEQDIHWMFHDTGVMPDGAYCPVPSCFVTVPGNRMTFVPKEAVVDRVICIEPTFNIFLQKGVGGWIRRRLKAFGIDLDNQRNNQILAQVAQWFGLATLDLSSASDTICTLLVQLLLPLDWFMYLNNIRSKCTLIEPQKGKGSWHVNQKFSSMGNGFTFELETLIFWALAPECDTVSVYGDDIICNQYAAADYIETLETLGFTINVHKSYTSGRFFESCGKHFFDGIDVTPVYQKEVMKGSLSLVRGYNRLSRWRKRVEFHFFAVDRAMDLLIKEYGRKWKILPFVPTFASDVGFHTDDPSKWRYDPNRGYQCTVLVLPKVKTRVHESALFAWKMHNPHYALDLDSTGQMSVAGAERLARPARRWVRELTEAA